MSRDLFEFYRIYKVFNNRPSISEKIELANFDKQIIYSDSSTPKTFSQVL